jgi:sensor c-di-GMP phosphodiesterase-like protein
MEKELEPGTEQRYVMMFTDKAKEKETCPLPAGLFINIPYQLSVLYIIKRDRSGIYTNLQSALDNNNNLHRMFLHKNGKG